MKKILFLLSVLVCLTSCMVQYDYCLFGDVSLLNNNGEVLRTWDNATIHQEREKTDVFSENTTKASFGGIKEGGSLSFSDANGTSNYISGGIIIVENIRSESATVITKGNSNKEKQGYIDRYNELEENIRVYTSLLKNETKGSKTYNTILNTINNNKAEQGKISSTLLLSYGFDIRKVK